MRDTLVTIVDVWYRTARETVEAMVDVRTQLGSASAQLDSLVTIAQLLLKMPVPTNALHEDLA